MMPKQGLYIHIPFCRKKCFYCSFIVAVKQKKHEDRYVRSLCMEMGRWKNFSFDSVYLGGGTPSQISEENFSALMQAVRKTFRIHDGAEIAVEVNPDDVSPRKLECYQINGVNRLSLGVQTFQDCFLRFLGRCHDARQIRQAYDMIREQGFDNVSVDLMYGFPGQELTGIDDDLDQLADLSCEHVSLYSLTIDPGSKFFVHKTPLPDQETMARQYVHVRQRLMEKGFEHYEVSNFSRNGRRSIHNLNYWQGGNYIGLGVGAHSHMDGRRWWNVGRVRDYIERVNTAEPVREASEDLTLPQRLAEALTFGLRMTDGVDIRCLQDRFGRLSEQQSRRIDKFVRDGFLIEDGDKIKPALKGLLVLDQISEELI